MRSETSLIQTIGRAARNTDGTVIMYADRITESMARAINETNRRRRLQIEYNRVHGITPQTIVKNIHRTLEITRVAEEDQDYATGFSSVEEMKKLITELEKQMKAAARALEFEKAADLRDRIARLKEQIGEIDE